MALPPDRIDYLPIIDRPIIKWPNDARVAVWISPNVEHYEYQPPNEGVRNPWPRTPYPDVQQFSYRDYGNRIGFWRMLEPLDKHGIRCCISLNLAVLEHFPEIAEAMMERDYDYMSHGIYNTRYLYTCTEDEEREFYRDCIDTLKRHTGKPLEGHAGSRHLRQCPYTRPDGRGRAHLPHRLVPRRPAHAHQSQFRQAHLSALFNRTE